MKFPRFNLRRRAAERTSGVPSGLRIYVIGDVHGRLDLLLDLLSRIRADNSARETAQIHIVMLGDLIDRGPQSAQVVDFLIRSQPAFATMHFIMGNHEEVMLRSLADGADPRATGWLDYGGRETLESYGVPAEVMDLSGWQLSEEIRRYVPSEHLGFMASFVDHVMFGEYLMVHAGIRPGIPLKDQRRKDLRWIREPFLLDDTDHGFIVVHGHTISADVEFRPNRIGIDTGAYRTGTLTALGLEGDERWLVSAAEKEGIRPEVPQRMQIAV